MKKTNNKLILIIAFGLSLVGLILLNIVIDKNYIYDITLSFHRGIFYFATLASCIYSSKILKYNLYIQISFGLSREDVFKKYILNLLFILLITLLVSFLLLTSLIINLKIDILKTIIKFHYIFLIPFYIFINFIFFIIGKFKNTNIFIVIILTTLFLFISFYIPYLDYISICLVVLSIILYIYNKKLIDTFYVY